MDESDVEDITVRMQADGEEVQSMFKRAADAAIKYNAKIQESAKNTESWTASVNELSTSVNSAVSSLGTFDFWEKTAKELANLSDEQAEAVKGLASWVSQLGAAGAVGATAVAMVVKFKTAIDELPAAAAAAASQVTAFFASTVTSARNAYSSVRGGLAALSVFIDDTYQTMAISAAAAWQEVGNVSVTGIMDSIAKGIAASGAMIAATFRSIQAAATAAYAAVTVKFLAIAAAVAAVAAAVGYAGYKVYQYLSNVRETEAQLAEELEHHVVAMEEYAAATDKMVSDINDTLSGEARTGKFAEPFVAVNKEVETLSASLKAAKERQADMLKFDMGRGKWTDYFGISAKAKTINQEVKTLTESLAKAEDRLKKLDEIGDSQKLIDSVKQMRQNIEMEAAVLGKSGREAEIAALEYRMLNEGMLVTALRAAGLEDKAKAVESRLKDFRQSVRDLKDELAALETAKAVEKLHVGVQQLGEQLAKAVKFMGIDAETQKLMELKELAKNLGRDIDFTAVERLFDQKKAAAQFTEMKERAKAMIKEMITPAEAYENKLEDLDRMQEANLLTQDQHAEAVKRAKKQFDEASKSISDTRTEMERLQATTAGSAESLSRIRDYQQALRRGGEGDKAPAGSYMPRSAMRMELGEMRGPKQEFDILQEMLAELKKANEGPDPEPFVLNEISL